MRIGLISDTHGLLRPQAVQALTGCAQILHAGDIGPPAILEQLRQLAPTHAVRGNNDREPWAADLPLSLTLELAGYRLLMLHDLKDLRTDPVATGIDVVVSGHSHQPAAERRDGVLYLNPGSAGRRRFRLPIALGYLELAPGFVSAELLCLEQDEWMKVIHI